MAATDTATTGSAPTDGAIRILRTTRRPDRETSSLSSAVRRHGAQTQMIQRCVAQLPTLATLAHGIATAADRIIR